MWQLHRQGAGGIVGDEMGLGKTVQVRDVLAVRVYFCAVARSLSIVFVHLRLSIGGVILANYDLDKSCTHRVSNNEQVSAFLGALRRSSVMRRALILCPATVLSHWMAELHVWAPQLRVVVLHRCVQAFNAVSGSSGTCGDCSSFAPPSPIASH